MQETVIYPDFYLGQQFPEEIGVHDKVIFDVTNGGCTLYLTMKNPTPLELEQFVEGKKEIRLTCFPDCLWLTFQFGNLHLFDAPYTPHLSIHTNFPGALEVCCSYLTVVIFDSEDGRVRYCDYFAFSRSFEAALKTGILMLLYKDFQRDPYFKLTDMIMAKYSSEEIAEHAIAASELLREQPGEPWKLVVVENR